MALPQLSVFFLLQTFKYEFSFVLTPSAFPVTPTAIQISLTFSGL